MVPFEKLGTVSYLLFIVIMAVSFTFCWVILGHLTRKIVAEMTYNVSSETLNRMVALLDQSNSLADK